MVVVTLQQLLEAGIHFGHQTRRWNPKMARFIFGQRNGIYIIDLQKTLRQVHKAYNFVRDAAAAGGQVLFVGTKKQAREPIEREAKRCGMHYVNSRWLGGALTNFETIQKSIRSLLNLEGLETSGKLDTMPKKEAIRVRREIAKLNKNLIGIKGMSRLPSVIFVIDAKKEAIAVREAERVHATCIGVVDTNADPDAVAIPVPGNDDAIRAVALFCRIIADAVLEGKALGAKLHPADAAAHEQRIKAGRPAVEAAATLAATVQTEDNLPAPQDEEAGDEKPADEGDETDGEL